ncbi:MAG: amidohydrolase [Chloroflexi bacterium]|nr:amidohydrolase [Chloroflexota bacterium]
MSKNGFKVMDSDMHVYEPWDLWLNYIDPEYKERAPVGTTKDPLTMNMAMGGKLIANFLADSDEKTNEEEQARQPLEIKRAQKYLQEAVERGFDPVSQLHAMETEGIDVSMIYPTRGMVVAGVDYTDGKFAAAVARAYNDWLADFCSEDSSKMKGVAMVLVAEVQEAVVEARRAREKLGFVGIYLHPNPIRGRNWHDPAYDPLWAQCQQLGMGVTFHETFKCGLPQAIADRFYKEPDRIWTMGHVACHPIEQMYACLCMCAGGVLEKFPQMRVAFLECNASWLPFWLWRMDEHHEHRQEQASKYLSMKPSDYFKRQCYLVIDPDEEPAKYALDWIGDDNFIFSTDYPHPDGKYPFSTEAFLKLPLSDEAKRKVLWDNCARLYGVTA